MKRVYIYVNGILTWPGSSKNWNRRAVTHTHLNTDHRAESLEYLSLPFFGRKLGEKKRSKKLLKKIEFYLHGGFEIVLVGHSNGCDVIADSLKVLFSGAIKEVHLISSAGEADFNKNGINEAHPDVVSVWIATKDKALKLAKLKPAKWVGYGDMGAVGPKNAREDLEVKHFKEDFGHSDWFKAEEFDRTMARILK